MSGKSKLQLVKMVPKVRLYSPDLLNIAIMLTVVIATISNHFQLSHIAYYSHKETGQSFPTTEALLRYVNYLRNEEPDVPNFKKHFMNDDGTMFVERPWETDTKHTLQDYIHGRVGKCKGMTPESSFATATNVEMSEKLDQKIKCKAPESSFATAINAEMREKLDQKIKGKAPESSFSLANVGWQK